jgi:type IV pilus assembly protein PilC
MAFIITPSQLARRAEFYYQLGRLTASGLGLVRSLGELERNPPTRSYREPIRQLLTHLSDGATLSESLRALGHWLPDFDIALLHAGEQSGRLDVAFQNLADYYNDRAQIARQVIVDLAYPAFLFHAAIFIFPFSRLFLTGDWVTYLCQTFGVLIPIYAVVALTIFAVQSRHGEGWRSVVESLLHPIPVLGAARHSLALSRLAGALEALLSAGVTVIEAWELAATACGSPALRRAVLAWRPRVVGGGTPAEAVTASSRFPELFANQYATGEVSGKLDETLRHLHRFYQDEGSRKLRAFARWTPRAVYFGIMLMVAWWILRQGMAYIKLLQDVGGF